MGSFLSGEALDLLAEQHLRYEVAMLVSQACQLNARYPKGIPERFLESTVDDALLEAALVHLRLLDDFLADSKKHADDVHASDWLPTWKPTGDWLTRDVRQRINRQVAHLSRRRDPRFKWKIRDYTFACCDEIQVFIQQVARDRPERVGALTGVQACAIHGLRQLAPP